MNLTNDSSFVEMEECPACHIVGHKKTFARYSDGHAYCFYCSHYERGNFLTVLESPENDSNVVKLPYDAQNELPVKCLIWLHKYEITRQELASHDIMYSKDRNFLIFPYYGDDKQLVAWQGRDFKPDPKSKWYSKGPLEDVFKLCGERSSTCVLVEDIVSAIKVGRYCQAMPLFGTNCRARRLAALKLLGIENLIIWLDPDALSKALTISSEARTYGFETKVLGTGADPKDHTAEKIKELI